MTASNRRLAALGAAILALVVAAACLPITHWLTTFVEWVRGLGALGVLVYGVVYIVATVLMLPGSILTAGLGFLYGPLWGTLIASPLSVAAATVSFLLGRTVARDAIRARIAGNARFVAIDRAIAEDGLELVALLRLSPAFPFALGNYALGLTAVKTRHYVLGSWAGMLLGTFLYVYLGSLVGDVAELASGSGEGRGARTVLLAVGLVATVLVTVVVTRTARRALAALIPDEQGEPGARSARDRK
jgi:uncharacterized membrane protein YdjX (TVP38/TMEM64 family)